MLLKSERLVGVFNGKFKVVALITSFDVLYLVALRCCTSIVSTLWLSFLLYVYDLSQ